MKIPIVAQIVVAGLLVMVLHAQAQTEDAQAQPVQNPTAIPPNSEEQIQLRPNELLLNLLEDGSSLKTVTVLALNSSQTVADQHMRAYSAVCLARDEQEAREIADLAVATADVKARNAVTTKVMQALRNYKNYGCEKEQFEGESEQAVGLSVAGVQGGNAVDPGTASPN